MAPEPDQTKVSLRRGDDGVTVFATVSVGATPLKLDPVWLLGALREADLTGATITKDGINRLRQMLASRTNGELGIGTVRDAQIDIEISANKLTARLMLTTACGGAPATVDTVMEQVRQAGLADDLVDHNAIQRLLADADNAAPGSTLHTVVAQGTAAVDGQDSRFEPLVQVSDRRPVRRDDDSLDYRDLGAIPSVDEGTELMRCYPPTPGVQGRTVRGDTIKATDGHPRKFGKCRGASAAPGDPNLLIATSAGRPIVQSDCISVEPVLRVMNVDLSTGHIEYDGSLVIKDSVMPGMRVKVTGDVQVLGTIESADLDIGGNLDARCGILGAPLNDEDTHSPMRVRCAGNLNAGHVENACLEVAGDVFIRSRVSHSEIISGGHVVVGSGGQKRSGIVGGRVQAASSIRAQSIGSEADVCTQIAIACETSTLQRFEQIATEIQGGQAELGRMLRSMANLSQSKDADADAKIARANEACERLKKKLADLASERDELKVQIERCYSSRIEVPGVAFSKVALAIGDHTEEIADAVERVMFIYSDGHIRQKRFEPSSR